MSDEKKFYWLKLKREFFKRHDIQIIEGMPNGKDYVLFYLKLMCESIDHEGRLRFSDTIPYSEDMLATITNTNVDIVRSALKIFVELGKIDILDDKTIFMTEVLKLIGSETKWAEYKRNRRLENVQSISNNVQQEKDIEIDKEIEIEKEVDVVCALAHEGDNDNDEIFSVDYQLHEYSKGVYLNEMQVGDLLEKLGIDAFDYYIEKLSKYITKNKGQVKNHYETILKWYKQDARLWGNQK